MNFFKIKTSWSNAEFVVLKLAIGSVYVLIGAYFHEIVFHYFWPILVLFGITVAWSSYLWLDKMEHRPTYKRTGRHPASTKGIAHE